MTSRCSSNGSKMPLLGLVLCDDSAQEIQSVADMRCLTSLFSCSKEVKKKEKKKVDLQLPLSVALHGNATPKE